MSVLQLGTVTILRKCIADLPYSSIVQTNYRIKPTGRFEFYFRIRTKSTRNIALNGSGFFHPVYCKPNTVAGLFAITLPSHN